MIPTNEDFLASSATWRGEHEGIGFELSWHGKSEYNRHGTWCYYLLLVQEQFYPDDWRRLRMKRNDHQLGAGSWSRDWDYDSFPDLDPHGGWTFGEMKTYLGRDGKEHERIKVGCDYGHHFDEQGGYWQGRQEVEQDARHSIDKLVKMFPKRRPCCAYSGKYDDPDQFYLANNGSLVHKTYEEKMKQDKYEAWWPAAAA